MAKNLRGSKRLQVIQNWLNGRDDDEWEVFPCRTEGKYIVKPRKEPHTNRHVEPIVKDDDDEPADSPLENDADGPVDECEHDEPTPDPKPFVRPKTKRSPPRTPPNNYEYDPTINLEILNQLKLLGEEFKIRREKKEQKRMIKEVVQKQISRPRMQYNYEFIEPEYKQYPNTQPIEPPMESSNEPTQQPQQIYPVRRNRIFADVI